MSIDELIENHKTQHQNIQTQTPWSICCYQELKALFDRDELNPSEEQLGKSAGLTLAIRSLKGQKL